MNQKLVLQENDLELVISEETLGHLTTNALQIKKIVENAISNYSIGNYDSSNIDKAKKDKATLNKAAKALNSKRIEIEKEFVKPFAEFKEIISETVKLINECSLRIDNVVKEEECRYKEEKRAKLIDYYNGKNVSSISFDRIEKTEWLNKGAKENKILEEIDAILSSVNNDLEALSKMPNAEALQVYYKQCLDLSKTLQYAAQLNEQNKRAEEKRKETEEQNMICHPENIRSLKKGMEPIKTEEETGVYIRTFKVKCSRNQLIDLSNYMNQNNIKFEKI